MRAALAPDAGDPLLSRPSGAPDGRGGCASYILMQTQEAAGLLADRRGDDLSPAHLLLAVIDQADSEAMALLAARGIDPGQLRRVALSQLGEPLDLPLIEMPPMIPAGYMDHPILGEDQLDPAAWHALVWRQRHLPLDALKSTRNWECLFNLEAQAAANLYRRLRLHPDQELSLADHHLRRVRELAHEAHPDLVPLPSPLVPPDSPPVTLSVMRVGRRRRHWQPRFLYFTIGWGTWFGNRWSGIRGRWDSAQTLIFAFRTRASYKGAPTLPRPPS